MIAIAEHLGIGLYTPAEAAFYARLPQPTITRWIHGTPSAEPVVEAQLPSDGVKLVTFLDFVQAIAIREIRQRYRIPLQRIRSGLDEARERYDLKYPLACDHRIFLFSDQSRSGQGHIVIRLTADPEKDERVIEDRYVQLTGKNRGNLLMRPIAELFLDDLTFDPESRLATQYRPMRDEHGAVLMDPHLRFGEPIIESCGCTAETLWWATTAEGGIEEAAAVFEVSPADVALANRYYDHLLIRDAQIR